jgi:hypothetical protein
MKRKAKYLILLLLPIMLLTGCMGGGGSGGFDILKLLNNPIIFWLGVLIVLWLVFSKKK